VFPTATMSSTSGDDTLPSGRTGTDTESSGLRHTNICNVSPGPMMYPSDSAVAVARAPLAGCNVEAVLTEQAPVRMAVTIIAATLSALARLIDAPTSLEFDVAAHLPRCIAMRPND